MRKKTKKTKRNTEFKQGEGDLGEKNGASIVFVDELSSEIHVQDQTSPSELISTDKPNVKEDINCKDGSDLLIAVIDKNPTNEVNAEEEEGDDAPEDVSFKASKESAIRERMREKEVLLDTKRKEKQMRIERNERLRKQKERKRTREYSRLPMEVLQQVAKQQESQDEEAVRQTVTTDHVTFDSSSEDDDEDETDDTEETPPVKVLVLPRETKKPKKIQQSASLFLQERLFGDRIQRISATNDSDRKRSTKVFCPATKFSRKYL